MMVPCVPIPHQSQRSDDASVLILMFLYHRDRSAVKLWFGTRLLGNDGLGTLSQYRLELAEAIG